VNYLKNEKLRSEIMSTKSKLVVVALGLIMNVPGLANAAFNFTTIDVPGSTRTSVNGNLTNAIAGEYDDTVGKTHGFVLINGVYTTFDVPNAIYTSINGINANNQYNGTYKIETKKNGKKVQEQHAFVWNSGSQTLTTLDPLGSTQSQGGSINTQGDAVGGFRDIQFRRHAFLYSNGFFNIIDPPNGDKKLGPVALGINDYGQIVGTYVDASDHRHGFKLSGGVYSNLDVPNAAFTVAEGINATGQIGGLYFDSAGDEHGFVFSNGVYAIVDFPNATATAVYSINNQGEIVGEYTDVNGIRHGFVGTPVSGG
jgi:probable HAF family extracellular repeat protein